MKYLIPFNKHPRRNLPPGISKKRTEANFVLAFGRIYHQEFARAYIRRELYIPNLGIADMVSLLVSSNKKNLLAFEVKIKDWRKALAQAYRYKYYANFVFVVLPYNEAFKAEQFLHVFHATNIGLWGFDKKIGIQKIYNPRRYKPKSDVAYNKALQLLQFKSPRVF